MKRILIVDDKEENIYYLQALLAGHGYTVDSVRHGAEALVKARQTPPDLIVSDLLMPVMDGYTLLRLCKADARLRQIPFIVYTATYTEPEDERLALSLGADAFILKPAEPEDFLTRIREVHQNVAAGTRTPAKFFGGDEKELLKVYSETLIRKLEEKTLQLEEANRVLLQDIARRKQTELEREQYFKFFQISTDLMAFADPNGCFTKVNQGGLNILGYSEAELLSKPFIEFVHPDDRARTLAEMERQMKIGNSINFVNRYLCKDGSARWLSWRANYVAADQLTYATARDITDRIGFEEQLRLLHSAVLQTRDSILITDAELDLPGPRIVFVNPAFTRMTGYAADEAIGQTPRILQGLRTDRAVLRRLRKNLEKGEVFEGEAIQYRKDGTEYYQEWQVTPLRNDKGKTTHYVAIQRDVTKQRNLEMQFRQSQKMEAFGQLAGGVAHDFNNILAVIQMQAGLLKTDPKISAEQHEFAGEIEQAAERGASLTRQLLLFSRQQALQPRKLNLHDSITSMSKMLQRTLGEPFHLQFKFSGDNLWIHADPGMIDQVLLNLVVNARDAMTGSGRIVIETTAVEFDELSAKQAAKARPGAFACLSVTDTGRGMAPEILPQIFEPFFTTKEVGQGTGLGLATVFGIVQQHKGWISVYSEVGRGSTFRVYLPRLDEDSDTQFVTTPPVAAGGGKETILLVEDETTLRFSVRTILSRLGYRVLEAANGPDALAIWQEHHDGIDLLLTDMVMPGGLSGKDLAGQMLAQNPRLKVIYASGYSPEITAKDFQLEPGVNFLTKPFEAGKLAAIIRNRLDQAD